MILIGALGGLLIAGYVTLAALGVETTGYVLFLASPAVTGVLGLVVSQRINTVAATQAQTTAVVAEQVSGIDTHLAAQDQTLGEIHAGVVGDPIPPDPPAGRQVPTAREATDTAAPVSLFGPLRGGR